MLREKSVGQIDQLAGFAKARKEEVFFQLLVVVLDEVANDVGGTDHGVDVVDGMAVLQPGQHLGFFFQAGVAETEADEEAVELGLGQAVDAFLLDRVLGRQDHEWLGQRQSRALDGDLVLLHRFE